MIGHCKNCDKSWVWDKWVFGNLTDASCPKCHSPLGRDNKKTVPVKVTDGRDLKRPSTLRLIAEGSPPDPRANVTYSDRVGLFETKSDNPYCFNGVVSIIQYKHTVEVVSESIETYCERLQKLWDYSDNYHDSEPLMNSAYDLGYTLKGNRGSKMEKK